MNGDLSRVTFDTLNHYTRVVMQQGRVQLDADFNEQTAILLHYLQTLAADIIGKYAGPDGNVGFSITSPTDAEVSALPGLSAAEIVELKIQLAKFRLLIGGGRYYVAGRLSEIERAVPYLSQADYPLPDDYKAGGAGLHLVYLDVWERHITPLDDPNIHEPALGNADTAARTKQVWQVKIGPELLPPPLAGQQWNCTTIDARWDELVNGAPGQVRGLQLRNRGKLKAKAMEEQGVDPSEPCVTSPEARFRGLENQLYRVEIHKSGPAGTATFKWSRDNATIVAAYKEKRGNDLIVMGMRDSTRWFAAGDWVELTHDALELRGEPGTMVQLASVDGEALRINPATADGVLFDPGQFKHAKVRRWNQQETNQDPVTESNSETAGWLELEDGIRIQFQPPVQPPGVAEPATYYRTGDYWLLPARVATGDVEWPGGQGDPLPIGPHGIDHHYAPLAVVTIGADGKPAAGIPLDLRHRFNLTNVCVGP